jgi:hypothetical protein
MAIAWEPTLPTFFVTDGFQGGPPQNTVYNQTLSGRFKSQLVSNHDSEPFTGAMVLSLAELGTFRNWFKDPAKCNRGNAPFQNLGDATAGIANAVWKFTADPTWSPYEGGGHFLLRLPLVRLPDAPV